MQEDMALFPAFAGLSNHKNSPQKLEWLSNQSFHTDDALSLHQRATEKVTVETQSPSQSRPVKPEREEKSDVISRKKRKKEKRPQKKHRKGTGRHSDSSGSGSDTVYPSDLLKKPHRPEQLVVAEGSFVWLDDLRTPTDQPFCLDRKAEPANWQYKSLYRGDIARYRRKGNSSLGLDPRTQGVCMAEQGPKKKRADRKPERYFSRSVRQRLSDDGKATLSKISQDGAITDYIPVPSATEHEEASDRFSKGTISWVNPLGVYDPATSMWLQGKGQPEEGKGEEPPRVDLATERVEHFNRTLRENPTDTQMWLKFVQFQDQLAGGPGACGSVPEKDAERRRTSLRATLEKKVAILERAMESNPGCIELKLERLRLCRELWEPAALLKEWKKLVFLHPNSASLWRKYLLFVQSNFSTFSVTRVHGVFGKCLTTLASVLDGSMVSHPALPGTEEDMLAIFLQQCHFLRQAGHSEKAVSLFQALLDFTFFKPDTVKTLTTRQQVEFFEPFWDSGEPRVGERASRGWNAWMHQQEKGGWVIPSEPDDDSGDDEDDSEVKDKTLPKWQIWLDVETSREANQWLPWRPDTAKGQSEEDCEDPDRQVLFDDIGPSMIRLSRPDLRLRLLCCFLQFLGLPGDGSFMSAPCWSLLLDSLSLLNEGWDPERPLTSYDLPLNGVSPLGHMTSLHPGQKAVGLCKQGEEFLQNVFHVLLPLFSAEERAVLSLYRIQYEKLKVLRCICSRNKKSIKVQGKRSKRLVKRLLKEAENRGRLDLWREYAHLEWRLGNLEEARKVFDTALGLGVARGLSDPALCDLCLLYAQLEVEAGGGGAGIAPTSSLAVYVLTKLSEGSAYSPFSGQFAPVSVLKARKSYEQALLSSLPALGDTPERSHKLGRVVGLVGCFALFQYLTVGVDAADTIYSQTRERLEQPPATSQERPSASELYTNAKSAESQCEAIAVQQAALLRYHTSTNVYPLSRLRLTLTSALSRFASSAPLWRLFLQVENRFHSAGRARRFFHAVFKSSQSIVPHLFAISAEQQRKQLVDSVQRSEAHGEVISVLPENGLSNRIRYLFENAIATEHGAHCPLLWRMYIHFLVSEGNTERGRGIFYKALQDIPWVKGLYMDAAQLFPEHVQEFLDLMAEKELRLRVPMEEVDILLEE